MRKFLKENWLYILIPIVLVLGALALLAYFGQGDGQGNFSGYDI
ncbi:MAG TPA: hypothetical protein PLJ12_03800 [Planctomycetota bacterium]|nr:hypothetical protein [Planctomycetota bacterium]